jgi:hypothetical protein
MLGGCDERDFNSRKGVRFLPGVENPFQHVLGKEVEGPSKKAEWAFCHPIHLLSKQSRIATNKALVKGDHFLNWVA